MLAAASPAHAQPPSYPVTIIAALPGDAPTLDDTILVGSSGQLYHRSADDGTWRRRSPGGLSAELRGAARAPTGGLIAAGAQSPVFRFDDGLWSARPLPNRGETAAPAPGSSPVVAIGRNIYAMDKAGRWQRLTAAPRPMSLVWAAGTSRIWVADAHGGLYRSTGAGFTLVRHGLAVGDAIVAMAGTSEAELYAVSASGALLALRPGGATAVALPPEAAGLRIEAIGPAPGGVVVAGVLGGGTGGERPLLLRAAKGRLQIDGDRPALPAGEPAAAILADPAGGVLIAGARGHLLIRRGTDPWTQAAVSGTLPGGAAKSFPGALPARSQ